MQTVSSQVMESTQSREARALNGAESVYKGRSDELHHESGSYKLNAISQAKYEVCGAGQKTVHGDNVADRVLADGSQIRNGKQYRFESSRTSYGNKREKVCIDKRVGHSR